MEALSEVRAGRETWPLWRRVVIVWLVSRAAIIALGVLVTNQLAWHRPIESWQTQPWQALTGWDSVYYIQISHSGYERGPTTAFFPLYPMLIHAFQEVTGLGDAVSALAISNIAALIALAGVAVLARDRLGDAFANWVPIYLVLSPFAFALALAYSEGVFLALAAWLFVALDRRRTGAVAVLGVLAGLARINGLALVAPVLWVAWKRRSWPTALAGLAPVAGLAAFAGWLHHAVGDALAMVHVQKTWGGEATVPPLALIREVNRFASDHQPVHLLAVAAFLVYLALLIPLLRRPIFAEHRWEDVLYVAGIFMLPLLAGVLQSSGRFGLLAFPLFFALADLGMRHRTFGRAYMVFAPVAQMILFSYVALGYLVP